MGFIFKKRRPAPLPVQIAPPPPVQVAPPPVAIVEENKPIVEEAAAAVVTATKKKRGARSTIATGSEGLLSEAPVKKKKLGD